MSVVYPNSLTVLGQIYAPSIYGQDLDHLLVGSSGSNGLKIRINDINAIDIRDKGAADSTTVIAATNTQSIEILPADADQTTVLGNLTIDNGTTATSNADFQVYSTSQTEGHFFEQKIEGNTSMTITGNNAVTGSNTAVLTPLALTISNPDDNDGTATRPQVVLESTDVGGSLLNQFQIIGPDSQDASVDTAGTLGGGKTVLQVNGSNAGYATDQLVLYGNGEVQALDFITSNIQTLNYDTESLNFNAASFVFQDNTVDILTMSDDGTHTNLSAPATGVGATRPIRMEATEFVYTDAGVDYLTIDHTTTNTTLTAGTDDIIQLIPTDTLNSTIVGNLTIQDGASATPQENWQVYDTTQTQGHWFNQPINAQFQNLTSANPITGSNSNILSPTGYKITIPDDDSANTQIWSELEFTNVFDSQGATTGPTSAGFRIRGPNASETGTFDNGTTLGVGTTVFAIDNDAAGTYNANQLVLYGNGEVRADNFITSEIQTFEPTTDALTLRASSYIFQDDATDILVVDSTATNTTLTTGDTNIFQIVPTDGDVTTILGALTIDNGTTATSNADFQVYSTSQTEGHFFEEKIEANTSLTITEDNAVAGSNTAVLTPLALTISNPDDNDGTVGRPKVLLQSSDVGGTLLSQFQIIGPNSQDATTDTDGTLGGGKTILQVAGNGGSFAGDQLALYGNGEVQALDFITSNIQTLDFSTTGDSLNFNAGNYVFQENSVDILTVDRVGTTETSLTANTSQIFTIIPTDTLLTTKIGSMTTYDSGSGDFTDYQTITTNATNNPNGIAFDTTAIGGSNFEINQIDAFTGALLTIVPEATFNSDVNVTGNVNVTGDINITGQVNSSNVNNLNVNDLQIRLAYPENPATADEKLEGTGDTAGINVWTVPTGEEGSAEDLAQLYDKSFTYFNNSGFSTTAAPVSDDLRPYWEVRPGNLRITHVKPDLTEISMGLRVTDAEELQLYKFKGTTTTVMATFSQKALTLPITDPN